MSSRKSSRSSSRKNDDSHAEAYSTDASSNSKMQNVSQQVLIIAFVISVIIQCSVLYYLYNLEDADCNCIRDWRHNFCKAYALLVLFVGIILIGLGQLCKPAMILYGIIGLINVYAFFTYVGELNSTKCVCAVKKQSNLNSVMRAYRWLLLLSGIFSVFGLLSLIGVIGSKSTSK
jgi:hypothetical protein